MQLDMYLQCIRIISSFFFKSSLSIIFSFRGSVGYIKLANCQLSSARLAFTIVSKNSIRTYSYWHSTSLRASDIRYQQVSPTLREIHALQPVDAIYILQRPKKSIFYRYVRRWKRINRRSSQKINNMQSEMADFAPGAANVANWTSIRVVFESSPFAVLRENMTSSTKPEVHNILHCCERRTEPRPKVTCTENVMKFGLWFSTYASSQTNRHTDRQTDRQTHWSQYLTIHLPAVK